MKWHIAHRHEIPAAFDTLGQGYEAQAATLEDDNVRLKQESVERQKKLLETTEELIREREARLKAEARILELTNSRDKAIVAVVVRDKILEERLGICLKNPFEKDESS